MKRKSFMKKHLIDIVIAADDMTAAAAHMTGLHQKLSPALQILQDGDRSRVQHLGTRNETFSMAAIELARQHPQIIPAGIDMTALERDIMARQQLLPMLLNARQLTRMLEDTVAMLGVDIYNGGRAIYRSAQLVGELYGLAEIVAQLGEHFAKAPKSTSGTDQDSSTPTSGV
ncbi:hypothetical protein ACXR0O_29705 [Verrucomicrobiota bacterium sgz303538]